MDYKPQTKQQRINDLSWELVDLIIPDRLNIEETRDLEEELSGAVKKYLQTEGI